MMNLALKHNQAEHGKRSTGNRPLFLFPLVIFMLLHASSWASGWNDFSFAIDQKYQVFRANSEDISICTRNPPRSITQNAPYRGDKAGVIYGLYHDTQYIFARCHGANPQGEPTHSDPSITLFFIIEKTSEKVTGPLTVVDFSKAVNALGYGGPIPWQTVRQAYKASIRAGLTGRSDLFNALFGQLLIIAIVSPMVLLLTLLPGLLIAPFILIFIRKRKTDWGFGKSWLAGWGGLFFCGIFVLALISLADWFDMMFL